MSFSDVALTVGDLNRRALQAGIGPVQVALYEEAVRVADTHLDTELSFDMRMELIRAAIFAEEPEKSLAPFAWCLAQCDKNPEEFPEQQMLWPFKWVVDNAKQLVQVPMASLRAMVEDMERRYRRNGAGMRAVWKSRMELAIFCGQRDEARACYEKWDSIRRDAYADCVACEQDKRVEFLAFDGQDQKAVDAAKPILDGRMRCAEIPLATYKRVLLSFLTLGRVTEAMTYHNKAHRLIARKPMYVEDAARHIRFLALTDNLPRALKMFETHLPWPRDPVASGRADRFEFCLASRFLMERAALKKGKPLALRLAKEFPAHQESGRYDAEALAAFFDAEATRIASVFDARNGTPYFASRVAEERSLHERVTPCPLKPPAARDNAP